MVCVECCFVGGSICVFFAGAPFPFEMFAVAFCGSQVFCVPSGLLGDSSVLAGLECCYGVGAARDPGVEVTYVEVRFAGWDWLVAGEGVIPFSFCDLVLAVQ